MVSKATAGKVSAPRFALRYSCRRRRSDSSAPPSSSLVKKSYVKRDFEGGGGGVTAVVVLQAAPEAEKKKKKKECSDCFTTITPLWRYGPTGPKSLCNACGIRYRKNRAVEAVRRRNILGHLTSGWNTPPSSSFAARVDITPPSPPASASAVISGSSVSIEITKQKKAEELERLQKEKKRRLLLLYLLQKHEQVDSTDREQGQAAAAAWMVQGGYGGVRTEDTEAALLLMSLSYGLGLRQ